MKKHSRLGQGPKTQKTNKGARADGRVGGRRAEKRGSGVASALVGVCCSSCTQRQKGCCRRRLKNCSRARSLASSLAPSFVVVVVGPLLRLFYVQHPQRNLLLLPVPRQLHSPLSQHYLCLQNGGAVHEQL
jgi:hypothetical protein